MQEFAVEDPPAAFFEQLGRLVVEFGRLEYLIKLCVKDLLGQGFTEGMVAAESQRQFENICKKAKKLAADKLTEDQARTFSELIEQAIALGEYRNDTSHAFWTEDQDGPLRIRPNWDKATKSVNWDRGRHVSVEELRARAAKIKQLRGALQADRYKWRHDLS